MQKLKVLIEQQLLYAFIAFVILVALLAAHKVYLGSSHSGNGLQQSSINIPEVCLGSGANQECYVFDEAGNHYVFKD